VPDFARADNLTDEWSEIGELLDMISRGRPAWHRDALCKEAPPDVTWFTDRGASAGAAKAVCGRCLVVAECSAWALEQGPELEGVWGGMSKGERTKIRTGLAA
jgi:WhiB family redox-sensing transcriptional regulator